MVGGARPRDYDNGFKTEWEMFIRHLYDGAPFKWTLLEGAKGVQLAEAGLRSWKESALDRHPATEGVMEELVISHLLGAFPPLVGRG